MPFLEQSTYNTVAKYQSRTCTATFTRPTTPGSLLVVVCSAAGTLPSNLTTPPGFTLIANRGLRDIQQSVWYRQNAPATTSVSVTALDDNKSLQVRVLEYSGVAQANALDKVAVRAEESFLPQTGSTGNTAQADELVLGFVTNQYASTVQFGFGGSLVRLYDSTSPQGWPQGTNQDWERGRLTVHQATATQVGNYSLLSILSAPRRWIALVVTFRGASSGPARFTSRNAGPMLDTNVGSGSLTVFGPLRSTLAGPITPMISTSGPATARIGPFNYQYRLGGWNGLLIGAGTNYRVEGHDGLDGWQIRTSDDDLPRGDGALRGIDLQSARETLFRINWDGDPADIEEALRVLYVALRPQRDEDWDLIWRHAGQPLKLMRSRPTNLVREVSQRALLMQEQAFALLSADPRHYSARLQKVTVPVTPAGATSFTTVSVTNSGNAPAYPVITIQGPTSGDPVSRIELVNASADVGFDVITTLPARSVLVGDMPSRVTASPRSAVQLDGQSKYGAWQLPRLPFYIAPAPEAAGGVNAVYLRTTPAGAPVTATLEFRDTWAG